MRLDETNAKYKAAVNKHRNFKVFKEGDSVMKFYCTECLPASTYSKLKLMKYGPYKIRRR